MGKNNKSNLNEKESFFQKQNLITALIFGFTAFFLYFLFNNFHIYAGNDDYCISKLINNGELGISVIGYFFTWFIYAIQPFFGEINAYFIVLMIISVSSLTAISYIFLSKFKTKSGVMLAIVFDILYYAFMPLNLNYSFASISACSAGIALMIFASQSEKRKRYMIIQIICGFLLLLTGIQARYDPVLPAFVLVAVMALAALIIHFIKIKKESDARTAIKSVFKKYIVTGVLLIISVISVFSINNVSNGLKYTCDSYKETVEYNTALSDVIDHDFAGSAYKDFYKSIGFKSSADVAILKSWFIDSDFFTIEKLNKIKEYSREHVYDGVYKKGIIGYVLHPVIQGFTNSFKSGMLYLYLTLFTAVIVACILLRKRIPDKKSLVTRFAIIIILWLFFIMIAGGFTIENILILPLMFLTLYVSARYNNYQFIITVLLIGATLTMFEYITTLRLEFHSSLSIIFPAMVFIVLSLDKENLIVKKVPPKKSLSKKMTSNDYYALLFKNAILSITISLMLVLSSIIAGGYIFANRTYFPQDSSNQKLAQYIDSHPENTFAINQTCLFKDYYNPLVLSKEKKNVANYGLWVAKSNYMKNTLKRNGIKNIFRDSINDSKIRLVLNLAIEKGKLTIANGTDLQDYYNNHYAKDGETIDIVKEKRLESYVICKVVSKKAS